MNRRSFLQTTLIGGVGAAGLARFKHPGLTSAESPLPPVHSIIPVVGDGRWIWTKPPQETGYLEPRNYALEMGIQMEGKGPAQRIKATTPVPVQLPEQQIRRVDIQATGGAAHIRPLTAEAAQLVFTAPGLGRGDFISATVHMQLTLYKQYWELSQESFPSDQPSPPRSFRKQYCHDSPGIQTRTPEVRQLSQRIVGQTQHPWAQAKSIYEWVWENITPKIGNYTSVIRAIRDRVGDCEERAACFVALCRAASIPARLVWVPNHHWAEFYLVDRQGRGRWIPAHTAAYSWFGWTGVHELVIQKGDNLAVPEKKQPQRLLVDWAQWQGTRPSIRYLAALRPLPSQPDEDAGPGARVKDTRGRWVVQGTHALDAMSRDGSNARRLAPSGTANPSGE